jgi:hypothetical protein
MKTIAVIVTLLGTVLLGAGYSPLSAQGIEFRVGPRGAHWMLDGITGIVTGGIITTAVASSYAIE